MRRVYGKGNGNGRLDEPRKTLRYPSQQLEELALRINQLAHSATAAVLHRTFIFFFKSQGTT